MYSPAMSIEKTILVLSITLYAVDQASALRCYNCSDVSGSSDPDGDCFKNPAKAEFEITCSGNTNIGIVPHLADIFKSKFSWALPNSPVIRGNEVSNASNSHDCVTSKLSAEGQIAIVRTCILKSITNEYIIEQQGKYGISVDTLDRCDADLCNASSTLSIGLLTWTSFLILLFFM